MSGNKTNNDFDALFRERFEQHETNPKTEIWDGLSNHVNQKLAVKYRARLIRMRWLSAGLGAIVIIVSGLYISTFINIENENTIAENSNHIDNDYFNQSIIDISENQDLTAAKKTENESNNSVDAIENETEIIKDKTEEDSENIQQANNKPNIYQAGASGFEERKHKANGVDNLEDKPSGISANAKLVNDSYKKQAHGKLSEEKPDQIISTDVNKPVIEEESSFANSISNSTDKEKPANDTFISPEQDEKSSIVKGNSSEEAKLVNSSRTNEDSNELVTNVNLSGEGNSTVITKDESSVRQSDDLKNEGKTEPKSENKNTFTTVKQKPSANDDMPETEDAHGTKKQYNSFLSRLSVTAFYYPAFTHRHISKSESFRAYNKEFLNDRESMGFTNNGGLRIEFDLNDKWQVSLGTNISHYKMITSVDESNIIFYTDYENDFIVQYGLIMTSSGMIWTDYFNDYAEIWEHGIGDESELKIRQRIVQIPLQLKYKFVNKKTGYSLSAGIVYNRFLSDISIIANDKEILSDYEFEGTNSNGLGYTIGLGIERKIYKKISIICQPTFNGSFSAITSEVIKSYPYSFGLKLGLMYHF